MSKELRRMNECLRHSSYRQEIYNEKQHEKWWNDEKIMYQGFIKIISEEEKRASNNIIKTLLNIPILKLFMVERDTWWADKF